MASPRTPGGISIIYKDLIADEERNRQVTADVAAALAQGRNCLVLTNWTTYLETLADALRGLGRDPVVLRGGMGARQRDAALARLQPQPGGPPLLAIATGSYAGKDSTARRSTPSSSPRRSRTRAGSTSTPGASCAPTPARPPPRYTTSSPASSPPSPSEPRVYQPRLPRSEEPSPHSERGQGQPGELGGVKPTATWPCISASARYPVGRLTLNVSSVAYAG